MPDCGGTREILHLYLKNPDIGKVEFFLATALPFGASAAVHGFNRAAMSINHMVHEYVGVPCTHYFDDFTVIVPESVATAATELTEKFLDTLGWEVKKSKNKPMDSNFVALGVNFDLSHAIGDDSRIVVSNKEERVKRHRVQDSRSPEPNCGAKVRREGSA